MATPTLRVDGSTSGVGTVDQARSDCVNGETITITDTNPANVGATYTFTLLDKPEGASNGLVGPGANPCTIVLDGTGTWFVECDADGSKAYIEFAVLTANAGLRKPAFNEELQFNEGGSALGWKPAYSELVDQVEQNAVDIAAGSTDPNAIHDNVAGEINAIAAKSPVVAADILLIEDSAAANAKKKITVADLRITESQITDLAHSTPGGPGTDTTAIHDNEANEISAVAEKAVPVAADLLLIEDSEAANVKKRVQIGNLPSSGGGGSSAVPILPEAFASSGAGEGTSADAAFDLINDYSLECWVKPNTDHTFSMIDRSSATWGNYTFWYNHSGNLLYLWYFDGANQVETVTLDIVADGLVGKWFHLAVTRDRTNGEVKFYLNGEQLGATQASSTSTASTGTTLRIGDDWTATRNLDGYIAEVRIWNTVRTAAEIKGAYGSGLVGDETGLVAYWPGGSLTDAGPSSIVLSAGGDFTAGNSSQPSPRGASGLESATGLVSTEKAAAPTAGQVLKATSATEATWQTDSSTDANAIHINVAAEFSSIPAKGTPGNTDLLLIEDEQIIIGNSEKKKVTVAALRNFTAAGIDTTAIHDNSSGEINAIAEKTVPTDADKLLIEDAAVVHVKKKVQIGNLRTVSDRLDTTGASVDVGSAAPPTAGQVLEATSPTTAIWKDKQILSSAQGAYLRGHLATDQLNIADNQTVLYDSVDVFRGDIALNTGNGQITLQPGRTYLLRASVLCEHTAAFYREFAWYNVTSAAEVPATRIVHRSTTATSHFGDQTVSMCVVSPSVETVYDFRSLASAVTTNTVGTDLTAAFAANNVEVIEIGAVQADVVGGLEFMDVIGPLTAPAASVAFGAGGDGVYGRALDGDVDDEYELVYYWPKPDTTLRQLEIHPNGTDVGAASNWDRHISTGTTGSGSGWAFAVMGSAGTGTSLQTTGRANIYAKSGKKRTIGAKNVGVSGDTTDVIGIEVYSSWDDDTTNITGLTIIDESANLPAGSYFVLYRRTRSNMRSDVAAVYERMAMETVDPGALATTERTIGHSIYGGSIVGVSARVEEAVTAGSITVNVKVDGVTTLSAVLDTSNPTSKVVREAIGVHKFAADKNISVEFVPSSYDNAGSVASAVTVQVHMTNDALVTQNDRVVAKTVLSAAATQIEVTGLSGDLDGEYEVDASLLLSLDASQQEDLLINGATTNVLNQRMRSGTLQSTDSRLVHNTAALTTFHQVNIHMKIWAGRTQNGASSHRSWVGTISQSFGGSLLLTTFSGWYDSASADLTSLGVLSNIASGILAGSEITVRRIKA